MPTNKLNAIEKLAILQEIENGYIGIKRAARKYNFNKSSIAKWQRRYQLYGYEGLEIRTHNRSYSEELNIKRLRIIWMGSYHRTKSSINIGLRVEHNLPTGLRSIMVIAV